MSTEFVKRYGMKKIVLKKNDNIVDVIANLTHLYINACGVTEIGDLSHCFNLNVLYLHNNRITFIQNLNQLKNLTQLYLQRNKIKKIENLNYLTNLKKLYIGYNEIERLENLGNLHQLEELHIERQILPENVEFSFDLECLSDLQKTLKVFNISGLKLTTLAMLKDCFGLEELIAADNNFRCAKELGENMGHFPLLLKAILYHCPAEKNFHYRELITAGAHRLELLDNKEISRNTRNFIKSMEELKLKRNNKKTGDPAKIHKDSNNNIVKKSNSLGPSFTLQSEEAMAFQSWNSCMQIFVLFLKNIQAAFLRQVNPKIFVKKAVAFTRPNKGDILLPDNGKRTEVGTQLRGRVISTSSSLLSSNK